MYGFAHMAGQVGDVFEDGKLKHGKLCGSIYENWGKSLKWNKNSNYHFIQEKKKNYGEKPLKLGKHTSQAHIYFKDLCF